MSDHSDAGSDNYYTPVEDAKDLEACVARAPLPVQLVACVDTVQFSPQEVVLELLTLGASVHAYLPCGGPDAQRCASVALRLLGRGLGLTFPRTHTAPWAVAALPARRLCLVHVHGMLETHSGETATPPRVLLEDAVPLDVGGAALSAERYHAAGDRAGGWPQAALYRLFGGLLELDYADASAFAYGSLRGRPAALDRLVQALRDARDAREAPEAPETAEAAEEPPVKWQRTIALPVPRARPVESQFDFNSQAMDTQPPNSPERKPAIVDSPEHKPAIVDTPEHKPAIVDTPEPNPSSTTAWDASELASTREFSNVSIRAVCVGRQPAGNKVDLYWVPREHDPAALLEPLHNCIVTTVSADVAAQVSNHVDTRLSLAAMRRRFAEGPQYTVELFPLPGGVGITQDENSPTPGQDSLALPREPFVQFADLQGMQPGEVRYVHMVCLLTNAFQEPLHRYADLELTDFTASALPHKRLYSTRFLGAPDTLSQDSSFRAIVYPNQLEELDAEIASELGKGLVQLASDSPHGDLTHLGIVVDMLFKAEVYNGRLSFIVRGGAPVPRHTVEAGKWYAEAKPRDALAALYSRTREFLEKHSLRLGPAARAAYAHFFPESKSSPARAAPRTPALPALIPPLNADTRRYTTVDATGQFPALSVADALACDPDGCTLHQLKRLRLLGTRREGTALVLLVTDDLAADGLVPPACVLPLHIVGGANLRYFVGGDTVDEETGAPVAASLLRGLVGGTFDFQVQPGRVLLSGGAVRAVWCPVECTVAELRAQAATAAEARVKQEQQQY